MPTEVTCNDGLKIINIRTWGQSSLEELDDVKAAIQKIYHDTGYTKALVDARDLSIPSYAKMFFVIESFQKPSMFRNINYSYVSSKATQEEKDFYETTAYNRGFRVKIFKTIDQALAWLNVNQDNA